MEPLKNPGMHLTAITRRSRFGNALNVPLEMSSSPKKMRMDWNNYRMVLEELKKWTWLGVLSNQETVYLLCATPHRLYEPFPLNSVLTYTMMSFDRMIGCKPKNK